jgi:hypothetical protein
LQFCQAYGVNRCAKAQNLRIKQQPDYKDIERYSFQLSIAIIIFPTQIHSFVLMKTNPKNKVFIYKHLPGDFV